MGRTAKQIQKDVYDLLRNSDLARALTGKVYRAGYRPRDSRVEDATVIFTAGLADEIQTGVITINIFVPDILPNKNGVFVENGARTEELELLAAEWVKTLNSQHTPYQFRLDRAIHTMSEPEINQHFVVVALQYRCYDNQY